MSDGGPVTRRMNALEETEEDRLLLDLLEKAGETCGVVPVGARGKFVRHFDRSGTLLREIHPAPGAFFSTGH